MSSRDFRMDAKYIATTFQSASSDMGYIILCEQTKRHVCSGFSLFKPTSYCLNNEY